MRPVSGLMYVGSASVQVDLSLARWRHSRIPLMSLCGEVVSRCELIEQACARLPLAGLGLAPAGKLQVVEQEVAELLGGAQIELVPRELVDLLLEARDALREGGREARQDGLVHLDA